MDAIIKVGGSLAEDPEVLRALCSKLSELAKKHALVVVPGGGEFADTVRDFDQRFSLPHGVSHRMAILGMDQFGLLLSAVTPGSIVSRTPDDLERISSMGKVPIFLPSHMMFNEDPLENSWDVTSDSIAAFVAKRLGAAKVILVTDVDGIFTADPKKNVDGELLQEISVQELFNMRRRTSVDKFLPKLLLETPLDCYVVNGKYPMRISHIIEGFRTVCTRIV
ncbi:MAG: delta 1-pyrroline-5-carboxylate synthetase [Candidatus Bathyarchaeota archaeon]|nr:delta 1-pyrroline-5-carboxylate synthetase [Candidatus Bathyarchaeota archaeon]